MSVRVVEDLFSTEGSEYATVVLEADSRDELDKPDVKRKAMEYARSRNFSPYGIAGFVSIYPVDDKGETGHALFSGQRSIKAYRTDVRMVSSSIK